MSSNQTRTKRPPRRHEVSRVLHAMRVFLGSFLGSANQDLFGAAIADLVGRHPHVLRAIPKRSAHLTYAFCSDIGARTADDCAAVIRRVVTHHRASDVRLGGLRLIAAGPVPRLVVSDVQAGADRLHQLALDLADALTAAFPDLD